MSIDGKNNLFVHGSLGQACIRPYARLPVVKRNISFALALVLLVVTVVHGTTVQRLNLEDLVKTPHHILSGKVRNSRTYWSDNGKLILTNYTIGDDETIKRQWRATFEVTTIGGKLADRELHVSGLPAFAKADSLVGVTDSSGP